MKERIKKDYPPVNQMNQDQRIEIVKDIFSTVTNKYDFLNRFLSLRQDITWRRKNSPRDAFFKSFKFLDMATGTGDLAIDAVNVHANIKAIGLDFVQEMVDYGNVKIKSQNLFRSSCFKMG